MLVSTVRKSAAGMLASVAAVWLGYVFVAVPWAGAEPTNIKGLVATARSMNRPVALLNVASSRMDFYLNDAYVSFSDREQALQWARQNEGVLITSEPVAGPEFVVLASGQRFHVVAFRPAASRAQNEPTGRGDAPVPNTKEQDPDGFNNSRQ